MLNNSFLESLVASLWQLTLELSLILLCILLARYLVKKTTKTYNAYLLWLSIPVGFVIAKAITFIEFNRPEPTGLVTAVQHYVSTSSEALGSSSWFGPIWALIWISVTLSLIVRLCWQHYQLRQDLKKIRLNTGVVSGASSKYPVIIIDKKDFSPAVYGFIRPKIYFPQHLLETLNQTQVDLIIQHEEHHIKQQHLWLNLLWDLLVCCLWFNPLVYISRQNFRHDQELFCDYLVLNNSTSDTQKSYGHALLSTVSATHSVSLLCSWNLFNHLEERIMSLKKSASISSKIALAISGCIIAGCMSAYAANDRKLAHSNTTEEMIIEHRDGHVIEHVETFSHEVNSNGSDKIVWRVNGTTFVDDNGKAYVLEKNGEKRSMTDDESERFELAYAKARKSYEQAEEMRIEHEAVWVEAEEALAEAEYEMELAEEEMLEAENSLHEVELELEQVLAAEGLSKVEAEKALTEARKALKLERKRLHKEKARIKKMVLKEKSKSRALPPMPELPPMPPKK